MKRAQKGSALHTFLFFLSVTVAVGTAVIAIYKAYGEFIVKPRESSTIAPLESANAAPEASNAELRSQVKVLKKPDAVADVASVQDPSANTSMLTASQQNALTQRASSRDLLRPADTTVLTASSPEDVTKQLSVQAGMEPPPMRMRVAWIAPTLLVSVSLLSAFVAWRVRKRMQAQSKQRERMRAYA